MNARAFGRKGRIVDNTVSVIDFTGRVLQGIERGDWLYAADKIDQLRRALDQLAEEVDLTQHADELRQIPRDQVWKEVGHSAGTHYWLGRLIFRKGGDPR